MDKHMPFLSYVKEYVSENPDVAGRVTEFVTLGVQAALKDTKERAADMECALALSIQRRVSKSDREFVLNKIKQWNGKSALDWSVEIKKLEEAKEKS